MDHLKELKEYVGRMDMYAHVGELMYWDLETAMPKEGFDDRNKAMTFFSTEEFKMGTSDELKALLEKLSEPEAYESLDDMWKFVVRKMKKDLDARSRIPVDFYSEYVSLTAKSSVVWQEAKQKKDYKLFEPYLDKVISMRKQMALYMYPDKDPYDTLLDLYEEGMDSATVDRIFSELREELVPFIKKILAKPQKEDPRFKAFCDIDAQRKVEKLLLDYIGFDFDRGATGQTEHPFTLNFSSKDVRVSNHFRENDAVEPMFSAIHEGGHAIFEQNVDERYDGTVAGSCSNLGLHESQSRFFENVLGRNKNFWIPIYPKIGELLPAFADISLDDFVREINNVKASFIRTSADEVTYCIHVIIRYEIEKAIFREGVKTSDLPKLWNSKMQEYLGITPRDDAEGILQDMHWSEGMLGYFPTYLLGSIYDGMFLEAMKKDLGDIDALLAEGRIGEIRSWLSEKIHRFGSTRTPKDTIKEVCGCEVNAAPLMRYFKEKYEKLYDL
ncbi:MAG: carboxypeptidase M32 [Lachnospiraceae bacterium]|nr:carboxypeptidase M32 [Lachnospiraceae bacterium]